MKFELSSMDGGSYISYSLKSNEKIDNYALNTIMNNNIDGVFKMNKESENGTDVFYINITSKVPLTMLLDKPVQKQFIVNVIERLLTISRDADDYLLNPDYFLFEHENIYIDLSTKSVSMIYLPIVRNGEKLDFKSFIKKLLFDVCYDTREDCSYVAHLINIINSKDAVSIEKALEMVRDIKKNNASYAPASQTMGSVPAMQVQEASARREVISYNSLVENQAGMGNVDASGKGFALRGKGKNIANIPEISRDSDNEKKNNSLLGGLFTKKEKAPKEPKANKASKMSQIPGGMAIPGQAPADRMAIPGQASADRMAIPGQKPMTGIEVPGQQMGLPQKQTTGSNYNEASYRNNNVINNCNASFENENDNSICGSTVMVGGSAICGKTVMKKGSETGKNAKITRVKTNESVAVSSGQFKIGRERNFVNFFIGDNSTIGRIHAQIDYNDGKYYITDINSLNHTYLGNDSQPIQSGMQYELYSGVHFRLSDEEFIFTIG